MSPQLSYFQEIIRKSVHISTCFFGIFLLIYGKKISLPIFIAIGITFILFDFIRKSLKSLQKEKYKIFTTEYDQVKNAEELETDEEIIRLRKKYLLLEEDLFINYFLILLITYIYHL